MGLHKGYRYHDPKTQVICEHCGRTFTTPQALHGHLRFTECGEKLGVVQPGIRKFPPSSPSQNVKQLEYELKELQLRRKIAELGAGSPPQNHPPDIMSSAGLGPLSGEAQQIAQKLRSMKCTAESLTSPPLVTAFAYQCPNSKLSFFDFAIHSQKFPNFTPSLICILNQALFGLARKEGTTLSPIEQLSAGHIPVIFQTQENTLLIYTYLLSRWATAGADSVDTFMKYSEKVFSGLVAFHFDTDFLYRVTSDPSARSKARTCFEGNFSKSIKDAYIIARGQIGLS